MRSPVTRHFAVRKGASFRDVSSAAVFGTGAVEE